MIDVLDKKQMHNSEITGKEYPSKYWTCVISMFLPILCVVCMFCVYVPQNCYLAFLGQGRLWPFFGEDMGNQCEN